LIQIQGFTSYSVMLQIKRNGGGFMTTLVSAEFLAQENFSKALQARSIQSQ
jgi:hypothetical protein